MTDKLNEFEFLQKLGDGAQSHVQKVKRKSDSSIYAIKKVKLTNLSDKEKQNAINEIRIIASIHNSSVISQKEAFVTGNSLCIVMEQTDNGDLFEKICHHQKKNTLFKEEEVWSIFIQMVQALKALHELNIFHRDIKSANVFLNKNGSSKLGDMNVSKVAHKGLLYTQTGTPQYASPEVWRDQPQDAKSDIWSTGCVLQEMCCLKPPFRAEDMQGLQKKVLKGQQPKIPAVQSADLAQMIKSLLQVSPQLRPSAEQILQSSLVKKHFTDKLVQIELFEKSELMNTIKVPKNLTMLTEQLPKPTQSEFKSIKKRLNTYESADPDMVHHTEKSYKHSNNENDTEHIPNVGSGNVSIDIEKDKSISDKIRKREGRGAGKINPKRDKSEERIQEKEKDISDLDDTKRQNGNTSIRRERQSLENSRHEDKSIDLLSNRDKDRDRERERDLEKERRKYQEYLLKKNEQLMRKEQEQEMSLLSKNPSNHSQLPDINIKKVQPTSSSPYVKKEQSPNPASINSKVSSIINPQQNNGMYKVLVKNRQNKPQKQGSQNAIGSQDQYSRIRRIYNNNNYDINRINQNIIDKYRY